MIDLELLGVNGDAIVMTDPDGQRYKLVIDDALRAAVRRDRPAALDSPTTLEAGRTLTPREIQSLLRAGATAEEVASTTGLPLDHVHRFEGPVLAERNWAVEQARACRIGWEKDSPVLGELVVDRLATRGVDPALLEWDAVRDGRAPWEVLLTFVQGAEEKQARWVLDLSSHAVTALDDEARWLTEAASSSRRPLVFDQDSRARGASAQSGGLGTAGATSRSASTAHSPSPASPPSAVTADAASSPAPSVRRTEQVGSRRPPLHPDSTDALLADLAASRGQRMEPRPLEESGSLPVVDEEAVAEAAPQEPDQAAQVVSIAERRRSHSVPTSGRHPAGSRLPQVDDDDATVASPLAAAARHESPTKETEQVLAQEELPDMPVATPPKAVKAASSPTTGSVPAVGRSKRRSRRSVPSWDEIVFGAKPE